MEGKDSALLLPVSQGKDGFYVLQWYLGSQETMSNYGFAALLSLMRNNILYLDLGKYHGPMASIRGKLSHWLLLEWFQEG